VHKLKLLAGIQTKGHTLQGGTQSSQQQRGGRGGGHLDGESKTVHSRRGKQSRQEAASCGSRGGKTKLGRDLFLHRRVRSPKDSDCTDFQ